MGSPDQQGVIDAASIPLGGVLEDAGAPICFIDTEFTTLDPWSRRPWEIAIIRRDPGVPDIETLFVISDIDLSDADPKSLEIGGFFQRHPSFNGGGSGAPPTSVLTEAEASIAVETMTRGCHIVGAVPDADASILRDMLRRNQLRWTGHYHLMDIESIAIGYLKALDPSFPMVLPLKSDELSELCGVPAPKGEDRHTALGDARWVRDWWDAIFT